MGTSYWCQECMLSGARQAATLGIRTGCSHLCGLAHCNSVYACVLASLVSLHASTGLVEGLRDGSPAEECKVLRGSRQRTWNEAMSRKVWFRRRCHDLYCLTEKAVLRIACSCYRWGCAT
jgi:hypothetical protein